MPDAMNPELNEASTRVRRSSGTWSGISLIHDFSASVDGPAANQPLPAFLSPNSNCQPLAKAQRRLPSGSMKVFLRTNRRPVCLRRRAAEHFDPTATIAGRSRRVIGSRRTRPRSEPAVAKIASTHVTRA